MQLDPNKFETDAQTSTDDTIAPKLVDVGEQPANQTVDTPAELPLSTERNVGEQPAPKPIRTRRKISSILMSVLHWTAMILTVATIAAGVAGLWLKAFGSVAFAFGLLVFAVWTIYTIVTVLRIAPSKWALVTKAAVPIILSNTLTNWGLALAMYALVIKAAYNFVKSFEASMQPKDFRFFAAIVATVMAYSVQTILICLVLVSVVSFAKFFKWLAEAGQNRLKMSISVSGAKYIGGTVGLLIGIDGLWSSLNTPQNHDLSLFFAVTTLIWAVAALISVRFLSQFRTAFDKDQMTAKK